MNDFERNDNLTDISILRPELKVDPIKYFDKDGVAFAHENKGPYLPIYQSSPVMKKRFINENILARSNMSVLALGAIWNKTAVLGGFVSAHHGKSSNSNPTTSFFSTLRSINEKKQTNYLGDPMSYLTIPIFDSHDVSQRKVVGVIQALIHWRSYFQHILPQGLPGISVVLENTCGDSYSYEIQGEEAYITGNRYDANFKKYGKSAVFHSNHIQDGTVTGVSLNEDMGCRYKISIYPTQMFYDQYNTDTPLAITFAIAVVFIFTICMFLLYDRLVEQRQNIVLARAAHSTAIVSSLFPKNVRDRLLKMDEPENNNMLGFGSKHRIKGFLNDGEKKEEESDTPIADLFPNVSYLFCLHV